jgi:hypothetical protein
MKPTRRDVLLGSVAAAMGGLGVYGCQALRDGTNQLSEAAATANAKPEQANTTFLTWFRDPTTTMVVQWVGPANEISNPRISYQGGTDTLWHTQPVIARPYPLSSYTLFRAELTGLSPGTDYKFRVGDRPKEYAFRTMPAKATNTLSFISGGDCGVNPHAVNNNIQAARQDPSFAVIGGDLGYDNGRGTGVSIAFLINYATQMVARGGRLIPMVCCIGNHEVDGGYAKPRAKAPFFYALFDGLFTDTGYAKLDFGDYLSLVLLDTGHTTPIEGAQTAWLDGVLRERIDHPNVMVVNHVPAYPSYRGMATKPSTQPGAPAQAGTGAGNRQHWCPLFDKYRVPVVLEHHDHTFKRTKPLIDGMQHQDGVLYLGDGSWGRLRNPSTPDKLGFLATSSRDYHLSLHRIEGDRRFHLALDEFGRVMDISTTGQRKRGSVAVPG